MPTPQPIGLHKHTHEPTDPMPKRFNVVGLHKAHYQDKGDKYKRYPVIYQPPESKPAHTRINELRL